MRFFVCLVEREREYCGVEGCDSAKWWACGHHVAPYQNMNRVKRLTWEYYSARQHAGVSCFDRPAPAVAAMNKEIKRGRRAVVKYVDADCMLPWTDDADQRFQETESAMVRLAEQAAALSAGTAAPLPVKKLRPRRPRVTARPRGQERATPIYQREQCRNCGESCPVGNCYNVPG